MPKYVASRTLETATWNASIIKGDVAEAVRQLKQPDGGDLLIGGSGQLIDYLSGHDLIDEYRLMVHPLVLGGGEKRLFRHAPKRTLELVDSVTFSDRRRGPDATTRPPSPPRPTRRPRASAEHG